MGLNEEVHDLYDAEVPTITFLPSGTVVEVQPGTTVFHAAASAEIAIPSQCGGKCACALCCVKLVSGEGLVSPMRWEEEGHLGNVFFLTRQRLSCQLKVFGDVVVEVVEPPAKERQRGRYLPLSLIRKREKMEEEEELRRVRASARASDSPAGNTAGSSNRPGSGRPAPTHRSDRKRQRSRRGRNPGAPRPGDHRPPPGKKKKES